MSSKMVYLERAGLYRVHEDGRFEFIQDAPEPEVPQEIADLIFSPRTHASHGEWTMRADMKFHEIVLEAFRRGKESK